jgi:hypothetical protein
MLQREASGQMLAQGLHTIALGSMMTRRYKADTVFPCAMKRLLGGFTTEKNIDTSSHPLLDKALSTTGTPANAPDQSRALHHKGLSTQHILHTPGKICHRHSLLKHTHQADRARIARFKIPLHLDTELVSELHVITDLWMHIQGQMVGQQADVMT